MDQGMDQGIRVILLYAHDAAEPTQTCLGREKFLGLAAEGDIKVFKDMDTIPAEQEVPARAGLNGA